MTKSAYDVFLSYASEDSAIADEFKKLLEKNSLSYFYAPDELKAGDNWEDELRTAVVSSAQVLVLLSRYSIGNSWVATEVGAAWVLEKRIIPCLLHVSPDEIVGPLRRKQAIDVGTTASREKVVQILAEKRPLPVLVPTFEGRWNGPGDFMVCFQMVDQYLIGQVRTGLAPTADVVYAGIPGQDDEVVAKIYIFSAIGTDCGSCKLKLNEDGAGFIGEFFDPAKGGYYAVPFKWAGADLPPWLLEANFLKIRELLPKTFASSLLSFDGTIR